MTYILLCGEIGAGKTFISRILTYRLNRSITMSFADPIREMIKTTNASLSHLDLTESDVKKMPLSRFGLNITGLTNVRDLMVAIGNGLRAHTPTFWVDLLLSRVPTRDGIDQPVEYVIIDDWRFENELEVLKNAGTVITVEIQSKVEPKQTTLHHLVQHIITNDRYLFQSTVDQIVELIETIKEGR